ncbi:MAG: membrane dipeptidase [Oscillospiraceae bacterium]|jgi:membrane dipeptidase|nr:membrane dipeptidase [Oscillospiraceae bacterium]
MRFFDLHCDTVHRAIKEKVSLYDEMLCASFKKTEYFSEYIGCFAVWIPDELRGPNAWYFFEKSYEKLNREKRNFKHKAILTVEGGAVLGGELKNIKKLKEFGVKILTLTWNGRCEIGDGVGVDGSKGLTDFGASAIKELQENEIFIDISHASEPLFEDVCQIASKPFMSTHSNSKSVCKHRRNLTDKQFEAIRNVNGVVGVTFCNDFLKISKGADIEDVFSHIEYFLSLSGEDTVCIGSDFDGAEVPERLKDISKVYKLYEFMLKKNYSEQMVDKIFFSNAYNFFKRNGQNF